MVVYHQNDYFQNTYSNHFFFVVNIKEEQKTVALPLTIAKKMVEQTTETNAEYYKSQKGYFTTSQNRYITTSERMGNTRKTDGSTTEESKDHVDREAKSSCSMGFYNIYTLYFLCFMMCTVKEI